MTDLESPKKNNDCYFYYYSTCSKGDSCTFRHEPSALGCETMCSFWKEGKCVNVHCNFRHMELRKNRKVIPCYWESQPNGCLKPHCPFMHQSAKHSDEEITEKSDKTGNALKVNCNQENDNYKNSSAVDSLVVNFEEESDNESVPTTSPCKTGNTNRIVRVKTLEEIKLEKIQAASAAYYSYIGDNAPTDGEDLRQTIMNRVRSKNILHSKRNEASTDKKLTADEIAYILGDDSVNLKRRDRFSENQTDTKRQRILLGSSQDIPEIKVKSLTDIRAERKLKQQSTETLDMHGLTEHTKKRKNSPVRLVRNKLIRLDTSAEEIKRDESEVTSTSMEHIVEESNKIEKVETPLRKLNLKKFSEQPKILDEHITGCETGGDKSLELSLDIGDTCKELLEPTKTVIEKSGKLTEVQETSKVIDESVLLLDDDDNSSNVSLKAEDDLLNEIDNLLDD